MKKNKNSDTGSRRELKKISSSVLSRSMSVFGMTVASSARFVGLKVGDLFAPAGDRDERFNRFISDQVEFLVNEFGKLKGSFMKVGQMLSLYGEYYLPPEVNAVLKRLQSDSPPVEWSVMQKVIARGLGPDLLAELEIDPIPLSAASMGQVYRAVRKRDGERIALKVQYPGVEAAIEHDLRAIQSLLALSKLVPLTPAFDEIFKEVRMMLKHEADYSKELEQLQQFGQLLKDDPRIVVPRVFPEYSNRRILAMSLEEGLSVDNPEVMTWSLERRNRIGATLMDLMFREMFVWRVVQTDCHFGNFRIRAGSEDLPDRIILYDFGAMRKLPKRYADAFSQLVYGAVAGKFEEVIKNALELGFLLEGDTDDQIDKFVDMCFQAVEPFAEDFASPTIDGSDAGENPYGWGETDLVERLSASVKDAIFAFKFRPPPREAVFMNRKMVGTYFFLRRLGIKFGPRKLLLSYVSPNSDRSRER